MDKPEPISRRAWLRSATFITATSVVSFLTDRFAAAADATQKATKASVHYQDHPESGKMCGMCKYFIPRGGVAGHGMMGGMMGPGMMHDGACQLVLGRISPMGYCVLYASV